MIDPTVRPAAMGFHDGVVSLTVMLLTLLAGGSDPETLVRPGIAAAFAGAVSMSLGEYSSVSAARDVGIRHESPAAAGVSSFTSFAMGSAIPVLVVAMGGGIVEVTGVSLLLIGLASLVANTSVRRSVSVAVLALVVSLVFGHATA